MRAPSPYLQISYSPMKRGEHDRAVDLVLNVFNEFVAPQYPEEGVEEFKKYVNAEAVKNRFEDGNIFIMAKVGKKAVGIIEMRDNSHIALLFVDRSFQHQGIAGELVRQAIAACRERDSQVKRITVNSSPNAYDAYRSIGFKGERTVKTVNGIQFIPMELELISNDF